MWGGTLHFELLVLPVESISIHPPRVGRDVTNPEPSSGGYDFNPPSPCGEGPWTVWPSFTPMLISIHPPRVGRDMYSSSSSQASRRFQSTLPVWGGTSAICRIVFIPLHFNQPSPCGEGPAVDLSPYRRGGISIHPPRVGRDWSRMSFIERSSRFQSTLPVWGGTAKAHKNSL